MAAVVQVSCNCDSIQKINSAIGLYVGIAVGVHAPMNLHVWSRSDFLRWIIKDGELE